MKKLVVLALLPTTLILMAAGGVYLIYNEITTQPIKMGHTGQDTLRYVVNGVEIERSEYEKDRV